LPKNQHHPNLYDVTLKIEKIAHRRRTTVRLIGRVRAEDVPEVARQLEGSGPRGRPATR